MFTRGCFYKSKQAYQTLRMGNLTSASPGLSSSACTQFVQEVVSSNCVVIFSKTTCPYCKMAKNVFKEIGAAYKVVELDQHNDGGRLQETLAQMTGARTVPRVFINGQCIGGGTDTKQLHHSEQPTFFWASCVFRIIFGHRSKHRFVFIIGAFEQSSFNYCCF
uniref:Glutaredoxin-2, mitochondrial n=2 Tax=Sinocyclocheilus grahami TaxID=75366 RepID=A0A672KEV8_SINGR